MAFEEIQCLFSCCFHLIHNYSFLYPGGDSNPNRRNRNPTFYPLNYRDLFIIGLQNSCGCDGNIL